MRWVAAVLLALSVLLFTLPDYLGPSRGVVKVASGSLPRVESLKTGVPETESQGKVATAAVADRSCVRLGWLPSAERAQSLVDNQPLASEVGLQVDEVERELSPLHWVIIPPQPPEVALRQFRDIQRQGIDSYLVTQGENRNAISLGLFESRESAISVLEEKKRQNLNAVLVNFPRNQISYALSFEAEPELAKELVQAVKADYGSKFDFVEIAPCEGVATPEKNP